MNYQGPYHYSIILTGPENQRSILSRLKDGKITSFQNPTTVAKRPKLYMVKIKDEIVYVGYTSQSISSRLVYGLKANGKNGYHGYKWKHEIDQVELFVFVFDKLLTGNKNLDKPDKEFVEAIEAELVFKIRTETGKWPKWQNEIHFNNVSQKLVRGMAEKMYEYVNEKNKYQS